MDFVSDQLFDERRVRVLTLVDNHTRESLALHPGPRLRARNVVAVLARVVAEHGLPAALQVVNGPEFISKDLDLWAYWNKVKLELSRPGKPTGNATVEAFNARFRQECLNQHWVPEPGRRAGEDRAVARGQPGAAAQQPGRPAPGGVRGPTPWFHRP